MTLRPAARAPVTTGLALAVLALGGCGAEPAVRADGRVVSLTLQEYRILPHAVSVPAGRIQIVARNRGVLTHSVALEQGSLEAGSTPVILATTHTILPGETRALVTKALAPGRYLLVSTTGNQAVLGMSSTLIVH